MRFSKWIPIFLFLISGSLFTQDYQLLSPDKNILMEIIIGKETSFSVKFKSVEIISSSSISMDLGGINSLGKSAQIKETKRTTVDRLVRPVIREKKAVIKENFNELKLIFTDHFNLVFRAYDNGIAYRFETDIKEKIKVLSEEAAYQFSASDTVYFPKEESFFSHNERTYLKSSLKNIEEDEFCSLPVLVQKTNGIKILITETDLEDYPGMWLQKKDADILSGIYPGYPLEVIQEKDRDMRVNKHEEYLAITAGNRTFPWRILAIAENDGDLLTNQLSFLLAKPLQIEDTDWIKPGKVAWDWWNAWNIYGVDFSSGVNTDTYKYYIDFASEYNIEYIILDEGWYVLGDLLDINPDMNMEELFSYADKKGVGIIPWVIWKALDDQLEPALAQFEKWGAVGLKVDFMQRDDQQMVNYYHKIAKVAAKRKLLVDFHGAYKPAGLRRAYPNVITREGLKGLEHNKWSKDMTPEHNVTLPFIRMVAGPMDYTPGAMLNANPGNFNIIYNRPMSMGTRCHQLAQYIIYESPLQMLADSPSNYLREKEIMTFLSRVPSVWDDTKVLKAKVADYIILTRKNGNDWYVGAMTDGSAREFEINFSFLDEGEFSLEYYQDGVNVGKYAGDYKQGRTTVTAKSKQKIYLAPGGGWVALLSPL